MRVRAQVGGRTAGSWPAGRDRVPVCQCCLADSPIGNTSGRTAKFMCEAREVLVVDGRPENVGSCAESTRSSDRERMCWEWPAHLPGLLNVHGTSVLPVPTGRQTCSRQKVSGLEQLDTYALPAKVPQWQMGWSGGTPPSGRRRRGSNLSPSNFEGGVAGWDLEGPATPALGGYPGGYLARWDCAP